MLLFCKNCHRFRQLSLVVEARMTKVGGQRRGASGDFQLRYFPLLIYMHTPQSASRQKSWQLVQGDAALLKAVAVAQGDRVVF